MIQSINIVKNKLEELDSKYPNYNDVLDSIASITQEIAYLDRKSVV